MPLKGAFCRVAVRAPTVMMFSASAGKVIYFHGPMP